MRLSTSCSRLRLFELPSFRRLLEPDEIGAFALAAAIMVLLRSVRVFGTWEYLIAVKDPTRDRLQTCFTINALVGAVCFALIAWFAPEIAGYFRAPDLSGLLPIMAVVLLIMPAGFIGQVLMTRSMRMIELAYVRVTSGFFDAAVSIVLAMSGFGIASLVWGFLIGNVVATVMVIFFEPRFDALRLKATHLMEILRFGVPSMLASLLQQVGEFGPPMVLGRGTDPATVGFFARGQTLNRFFKQGVETAMSPVTTPWFAATSRENPSKLADGYLRILELVSAVTWPFYAFVFVHASSIVPLLLGPGWSASVPVAQALAVGGALSPYAVYGASLLAGHHRINQKLLFTGLVQVVRFTALILVLPLGLTAFAWTLTATHGFAFVAIAIFLRFNADLSILWLFRSLVPPAILGALILVANMAIGGFFQSELASLAIGAFASLAIWWVTLVLLDHPMRREAVSLFMQLKGRNRHKDRQ